MHAKDKGGDRHAKRAAQKNLKQKRAAKKLKKQSAGATTVHITTTSS